MPKKGKKKKETPEEKALREREEAEAAAKVRDLLLLRVPLPTVQSMIH